ncbi:MULTISPECIES: hypothetical protein [unclassified Bacillus (in: firmicutes)]|uniref:hypothetical protein n=1 Tax=unclassified Bacillus (in: firmicutes) TaxID=185979 RepID=UPI0030F86AB4
MIESITINELQEAQKHTNFVILVPKLPDTYSIDNISLRKESNTVRSSIRFEMKNEKGIIRIKQFFYDWAIPVITADTNLICQGKSFNINGIVGFIGTDYKGNQAACYAKWFTNIELSVLKGVYTEEDILLILKTLEPVNESFIKSLGKQSFSTSSFTSRFKKPKWDNEDEVTRVDWFENDMTFLKELMIELPISPPQRFDNYFLDSIGYRDHHSGKEMHLLYRSQLNYTDGVWLWVAPENLSDPLPPRTGNSIGKRQSWNIKKLSCDFLGKQVNELFLCRQNTSYSGWMIHWEQDNYIYHLYIRPSTAFKIKQIKDFLTLLHS